MSKVRSKERAEVLKVAQQELEVGSSTQAPSTASFLGRTINLIKELSECVFIETSSVPAGELERRKASVKEVYGDSENFMERAHVEARALLNGDEAWVRSKMQESGKEYSKEGAMVIILANLLMRRAMNSQLVSFLKQEEGEPKVCLAPVEAMQKPEDHVGIFQAILAHMRELPPLGGGQLDGEQLAAKDMVQKTREVSVKRLDGFTEKEETSSMLAATNWNDPRVVSSYSALKAIANVCARNFLDCKDKDKMLEASRQYDALSRGVNEVYKSVGGNLDMDTFDWNF
ncbi:MAG: hypothetical protein LBJ94_00785 [Puniceicoccales bacterium]|jgi:hypothetical protein|nr:hypothetical protein [Puniceicoccales bacterium]